MPETILVEGLTNQEFFEKYAAPGRVGLIGGPELVNRLIGRAQRHLNDDHAWSRWSHAFLFQGRRHDGHHWVVESDLDIKKKHIRLGVQENRAAKYFDETTVSSVAVIDFALSPEQEQRILSGALELVSLGTRYSLREIAGTAWAMRHAQWRPKENVLARAGVLLLGVRATRVRPGGHRSRGRRCGEKHRARAPRAQRAATHQVGARSR